MKVRIFVDGACSENPGPGGWAAVFNTDKECKILKGHE
ncbi:MAG: ribonuclease HI, partial [Lachnospiraceae bacterium]|nr:ribonuclease HI [Lachnospiraceae bacterium]